MYRAVPLSRQVASSSSKQCVRIVRRKLATEATEAAPVVKKHYLRNIIITTTAATGTFYIGSAFISYNSKVYHDFFVGKVPFGSTVVDYGESHGWDDLTVTDVAQASTGAVVSTYTFFSDLVTGRKKPSDIEVVENAKVATEKKTQEAKAATVKVIKQASAKVEPTIQQTKTQVKKATAELKQEVTNVLQKAEDATEKVDEKIRDLAQKARFEFDELVRRAEAAVAGKPYDPASLPSSAVVIEGAAVEVTAPSASSAHVYDRPLPLGFEPPPGFDRPAPSKTKSEDKPNAESGSASFSLPLIAPAVSGASEPIITHLAGTIDNLAVYLKSDPKAAEKAGDVLETAKGDLAALVDRIEAVKEQERNALEAKLDEQTRDYTLKLMELEMEAQDRLDQQEEGYKQAFEQERAKFIQSFREKLDHELKVQTELINERLKEEVIAQGIELQRRWIREIKVRVEQERGGRLAKLDELSANLKRLERIALDNSAYLDENIRVHALWSALRALTNNATSSPVRKPFREELRVVRHITAAREDPVVSVVLDSLEKTDVPDVGVEPFADLATWFANEVAPKVAHVALVPDENAGVLSYITSRALSGLRFQRQGLVPGDDVLSVLARAEYYLNEKNLDSATRELNQLKGPAKVLLQDWLEAARRRLEVQQALEIVQTQATLASLLVV